MKEKFLLFMLLVLPFFFSSCSKEDGEVEPMKWKTEVKKSSDGCFHVSPEGGTYVFHCTNYDSFWIPVVTEKEVGGEEKRYEGNKNDSIAADWLTVKSDGKTLTVTILPTKLDGNRYMEVSVQAGDAFDEFKFRQRGLKVGL